jgi:hypothetical protein
MRSTVEEMGIQEVKYYISTLPYSPVILSSMTGLWSTIILA